MLKKVAFRDFRVCDTHTIMDSYWLGQENIPLENK